MKATVTVVAAFLLGCLIGSLIKLTMSKRQWSKLIGAATPNGVVYRPDQIIAMHKEGADR